VVSSEVGWAALPESFRPVVVLRSYFGGVAREEEDAFTALGVVVVSQAVREWLSFHARVGLLQVDGVHWALSFV